MRRARERGFTLPRRLGCTFDGRITRWLGRGSLSLGYLTMQSISKTYPGGVQALQGVDFSLKKGEVHALIGENGAGKSTLMKILGGLVPADSGAISIDGRQVRIDDPRQAAVLGIGMVHQHFMLFPSLTVAQNITLGREARRGPFTDDGRILEDVRQLALENGFETDVRQYVRDLSVGGKQRVEILKALYQDIELLILDEPTAVLTPQETDGLFRGIQKLIARGYTIVLVTHKISEVLAIADRITVLRNGQHIITVDRDEVSGADIARHMVGQELDVYRRVPTKRIGEPVLQLEELVVRGNEGAVAVDSIDLTVHAGEIVGVAGVDGNGQAELEEAIGGLRRVDSGRILLDTTDVTSRRPAELRRRGFGYVPADRLGIGSAGDASVTENLVSTRHRDFSRRGLLDKTAMEAEAKRIVAQFDVRVGSVSAPIGTLSGGNIQKAILGREMIVEPRLLLAAQPTRGVDIGAIHYVHNVLREQRDAGCAILLISTDLEEVLALSDRVAVLYRGRIVALLDNKHGLKREEVGRYMLGLEAS